MIWNILVEPKRLFFNTHDRNSNSYKREEWKGVATTISTKVWTIGSWKRHPVPYPMERRDYIYWETFVGNPVENNERWSTIACLYRWVCCRFFLFFSLADFVERVRLRCLMSMISLLFYILPIALLAGPSHVDKLWSALRIRRHGHRSYHNLWGPSCSAWSVTGPTAAETTE